MSVSLSTTLTGPAPVQHSAPVVYLDADGLTREIIGAMRSLPAVRRECFSASGLNPSGEALAHTVCAAVIRAYAPRHPLPRPLIAGAYPLPLRAAVDASRVDRAMREPHRARVAGGWAVPRAAVGRKLLAARVLSTYRQDAGWRDTLDRYRTRAQTQKGDGAYVVDGGAILPDADADGEPVNVLDRAMAALAVERRERERKSGRVHSRDVEGLAGDVAQLLGVDVGSVTFRRVVAALVQATAHANGADVVDALASLAGDRSLNAVRVDATRGAAWLADRVEPSRLHRAVVDAVRASRDAEATADRVALAVAFTEAPSPTAPMGPAHGEPSQVLAYIRAVERVRDGWTAWPIAWAPHFRAVTPRRTHPGSASVAVAVERAVGAILRTLGAWEPDAIHTGRSLPAWPDRVAPVDAAPFPGLRRGPLAVA